MSSQIASVAAAVVSKINAESAAGTYNQEITAVRAYRPATDLTALDGVKVSVVPIEHSAEFAGRGGAMDSCQIAIGLQSRLSANSTTVIDPLIELGEQIAESLLGVKLDSVNAHVAGTEWDPLFIADKIDQLEFHAAIKLNIRIVAVRDWS